MTPLMARAQSLQKSSPTETAGFVLLGLVLVLITAVLVLVTFRLRARNARPCPHCNTFIPSRATTCPICAKPVAAAKS